MAYYKMPLLFSLLVIGAVTLSSGEDDFEDPDPQWPAGISPLDTLSYWNEENPPISVEGEANGCCMPKTWTGTLFSEVKREGGRSTNKPRPGERTLRFAEVVYVDENNKRVAQDVTIPRRRNATKISYILLFQNSSATLYAFSKTVKKCFKKELKGAQFSPMCLPPNATLLGSFSLGAGSGALKSQSWGFLIRDRRVSIAGNIILTPANCIPILAATKVWTRPRMDDGSEPDKKRPQVTTIGTLYTNIITQIIDPSVFTPPSYCSKTEDALIFDPDIDFTTIIDRFVTVP